MADGKKKRSLREAFGVVRPPDEKSAAEETSGGEAAAKPAGAPQGDKTVSGAEEKPEKPAPPKRTVSSKGNGSGGRSRTRSKAKDDGTGDPVITGKRVAAGTGGRGRGTSRGGQAPKEEMVPGKGGRMVPAGTPVNMTFTVSARERYLWTLELKRRGLTAVGVLRETMEGLLEEGGGGR